MKEKFKEVPGTAGKYACSKKGTVISYQHRKPHILKHIVLKNGYVVVNLHKLDSTIFPTSVANIVMSTWGPEQPTPDHNKVQFIDGNKLNLNLKNLRWTSKAEIMKRNVEKCKNDGFVRRKRREIFVIIDGITLASSILHTDIVKRINTCKKFKDNILIFDEEGLKKYIN